VNPAVGAPTPDDERHRTEDDGARPNSEPKHEQSLLTSVPASDRTARRARGTESRNAMFWPLAGTALVIGVSLLAFELTRSPFAIIVISAMTGLVVLMSDHYTD
jgi:hypothetical protein